MLENAAGIFHTVFGDEKVEVELGAELDAGHGGRAEGEALESRVGQAGTLKAALDGDPIVHESVIAGGVVGEFFPEAGEYFGRDHAVQIELLDAIEEVESETAEVHPGKRLSPFGAGETPEPKTLLRNGIAEREQERLAGFLHTRQGG